ncbi:MAG: hypothetical protein PHQ62_03050 [Clostridia bacterium]|nr:hypothetical protein [Clostridia bacterium]
MFLMFVDLLTRLAQPNVIIGIILCALGLGLVLISKKMAKLYSKNQEVNDDDKVYLILKGLGLVMILFALVIMILY